MALLKSTALLVFLLFNWYARAHTQAATSNENVADIPYTLIQRTACIEALTNTELIDAVRPVLKNVTERSIEAHGKTVADIIETALHERKAAQHFLMNYRGSAVLENIIQKHLHELEFKPAVAAQIDKARSDFGHIINPTDPRPLSPEMYEQWRPRYEQLRALGVETNMRGHLGEWMAASVLPGVTHINVNLKAALTGKELGKTIAIKDQLSPKEWLWFYKSLNEVDLVFNSGKSLGEVKFFSETIVTAKKKDAMINQIQKFMRFRHILQIAGVEPRDYYFIFVQNMPDDEELLRSLHNAGIKIILIKIKKDRIEPVL